MDEHVQRLIKAAKAVREAYPHGRIGPNQMPPGVVANRLMDELEAATTAAEAVEGPVSVVTVLPEKAEKTAKWLKLRDEVGKLFSRYATCPPGGKMEFQQGIVKLDFNIYKLVETFEAYLDIDEDFISGEFDPQFWHGHDAACHALFDILHRAIDKGERGNFGSPELTLIVDRIIELTKRKP